MRVQLWFFYLRFGSTVLLIILQNRVSIDLIHQTLIKEVLKVKLLLLFDKLEKEAHLTKQKIGISDYNTHVTYK